MPVLVNKFI